LQADYALGSVSCWENMLFKIDSRIEVLLVEDNPDDEELTLATLRGHRLAKTIQVVRDGEEALAFLSRSGRYAQLAPADATPDLILLDLKLPKVNGIEVLRQIRSDPRLNAVPVVVLTSSREERDVVEAYNLGVDSYIVKPVTFEQFTDSVRQVGISWLLLNQPPVPGTDRIDVDKP
jgi:two-component system response regulator